MPRLRISAISFLNTAPLMWDFEHGARARELAKEFEISYTVPSLCAEALRKGEADIGIIPSITYQAIPDLVVIPDIAIAARGPVRSILLVSKVPLAKIKSVAVDTSSRTSVALLEILFRKDWLAAAKSSQGDARKNEGAPSVPKFVPCPPDLEKMLQTHDAALLIGDPALTVDRKRYQVWDLAELWNQATGKPFVFAFWAVRKAALEYGDAARLCRIFQQSRDHGLEHVQEIAREWAPRVGISEAAVKHYLARNISYSLDTATMEGMDQFFNLASPRGGTRQVELMGQGP